jgi:hypothetical protein
VYFERAADLDLDLLLPPRHLPGIGVTQPVVRPLALPAVLDPLAEDAVFVAQPVAHGRQLQRRHRIEKAGGKPAQTAIAQAGIGLGFDNGRPVELLLGHELTHDRIEAQVEQVVAERAADQELHRQVVDSLGILPRIGLFRAMPTLRQDIAHRAGDRLVMLAQASAASVGQRVEHQVAVVERGRAAREPGGPAAISIEQTFRARHGFVAGRFPQRRGSHRILAHGPPSPPDICPSTLKCCHLRSNCAPATPWSRPTSTR